ncbi:MAG: hypothetical protein U9N84_06755 [Actinomycetota bacterium]|nr:hypothetical protein [Actinomycetota bacterium]
MSVDDWGTTDGLLDNYDLKVMSAWFGPDEENDDDRIFLFLQGPAFQDGEEVEEDHRDRFGTGKGWEVMDEGAEVEHGSGRNKFNSATAVGRLVKAMVALGDDVAELLGARGAPYQAKVFTDLEIHFDRKVVSTWVDDDTGETVEWILPMPASVSEIKAKKKGRAKKKAPAKSKAKAKPTGEKALRRKLIKLAGDHDEFDEFVDAALDEYPDVEDYDDLHADLLDEDGIFAEGNEG